MYVNGHQSCQVAAYEKELQLRAAEIVSLTVDLANRESSTATQSYGKAKSLVNSTEQELKKQQDFNRQLESQLSALREQHQQSLVAVRQGHELAKKHMDGKEEASRKMGEMEEEMDSMRKQREKMRHEIDTMRDSKEEEKRQSEEKDSAWKATVG